MNQPSDAINEPSNVLINRVMRLTNRLVPSINRLLLLINRKMPFISSSFRNELSVVVCHLHLWLFVRVGVGRWWGTYHTEDEREANWSPRAQFWK